MNKIIVFNFMTIDGFFAGPNGEIDWFSKDEESGKFSDEQSKSSGTLIFGHTTYEMMASFWPTPEAENLAPGTAEIMRYAPKVVFSKTLHNIKEGPNWKNIKVLKEINPAEIVKLKEKDEKGIVILGSGSIIRQFTNLGLIDEFQLMVRPVILGKGISLFKDVQKMNLNLINTRTFRNGNVLFIYRILNNGTK